MQRQDKPDPSDIIHEIERLVLELNGRDLPLSEMPANEVSVALCALRDQLENAKTKACSGTSSNTHPINNDSRFDFIDSLGDWVVVASRDGIVARCNEGLADYLGYEKNELSGMPLKQIMCASCAEATTLAENMPGIRVEGICHHESGSNLPISIKWTAIYDGQYFLGIVTPSNLEPVAAGLSADNGKLREIASTMPGIVYQYRVEPDGSMKFLFINDLVASFCGFSAEDIYSNPAVLFERIHADDKAGMMSAMGYAAKNESPFFYIFRVVTPDGSIRWIQVKSSSRRNEQNENIRTGFILDITDQKQMELRLRTSETFYQNILSGLPSETAVIAHDGEVLATNAAWDAATEKISDEPLPRVSRGDSLLKAYRDSIKRGSETAQEALELIGKVIKREQRNGELEYGFGSGNVRRWYTLRVWRVRDDWGAIVILFNDISDIKRTEQEYFITRHRNEVLLDNTDEMINTLSPSGEIMWANRAWYKNLGYTTDELTGIRLPDLLSPETRKGHAERLKKLRQGNTVNHIEGAMLKKDGTYIDVQGTVVPILEHGIHVGTQGFFRNVTEYRRAENERKNAVELLQDTLEKARIGYMIVGYDWTYLYVNHAAATQAFQKTEALIGKRMTDVYPGVEDTFVFSRYLQAMDERVYIEFESDYTFSNGAVKWYNIKVGPSDQGLFILTEDITEKKATAENIRKNRELLEQSQRLAHIGSWELDLVRDKLVWSDEIYRIFEIDPKAFEASYEFFLKLVHPDDRQMVDSEYTKSVNNKIPYDIVHRLLLQDGRIKYVNEIGETYYDDEGNAVRSVGSVRDITREKEAELLLLREERKYQQVVENISDALMIDDKDGRVVFANKQFLEIFGLEESDLEGLTLEDYIAPEYCKELRTRHNLRIAGHNVPDFFEYEGIRKDGTRCWIEVRVCVTVEDGIVTGTQSAIRDISHRKIAEKLLAQQNAELKKINRELDRFVYSVSHELRNPLLSMHGLIDLCENCHDPEETREMLQMMTKSVDKLDDTIKEILSYSRNSRVDVDPEILDMHDIIANCIEDRKRMGRPDLVIEVSVDQVVPFVSDRIRVTTILNNLLSNAVLYQRLEETNPRVSVSFTNRSGKGILTVTDNGEGIATEEHDRIFEMFYRNSENATGSGLGLYICKELVNKLEGFIHVTSIKNVGSTFTVALPSISDNKKTPL